MMRLAAVSRPSEIGVCCPVHDAFLIEADADDRAETELMRDAMREASQLVLPGFPLRTDAKIVRYPDRYADDRGRKMWETVSGILDSLDPPTPPASECDRYPDQNETGTCLGSLHPVPYSSFSSSSIPL